MNSPAVAHTYRPAELALSDFRTLVVEDCDQARERLASLILDPRALSLYEGFRLALRGPGTRLERPLSSDEQEFLLRQGLDSASVDAELLLRLADDLEALNALQYRLFADDEEGVSPRWRRPHTAPAESSALAPRSPIPTETDIGVRIFPTTLIAEEDTP